MSGHSKWSTIKRQKGAVDAKRGMTFTKLANAITIATKLGGSGEVDANPRLRMAVEAARSVNMPKDNVQRAIDRGLGKFPGQTIEEVLYEGFGPERVAIVVEGVTDNKLRTTSEVKNIFDRGGGSMGSSGSTSYLFDKKGEIKVAGKGGNVDDEMLELIDLGAEDVEDFDQGGIQKYLVYTDVSHLFGVSNALNASGFNIESSELIYKPNTIVEVKDKESAEKVINFIEKIEDHSDVQKVFANFDIPENLIP